MRDRTRSAGRSALIVAVAVPAAASSALPASAAALTDITGITTGQNHACALLANGRARCWGANSNGQVGDGTKDDRGSAVPVSNARGTGPLTGIARIVAGSQHTCAVLTTGLARCWGFNVSGQLGDGTMPKAAG